MSSNIGVQAEANSTSSTAVLVPSVGGAQNDGFVDENVASGVFLADGQEWRGPQRDTVLQEITQDLLHRRGASAPQSGSTTPVCE
ncbi:hypothetical protein BSKO_05082 [Bryopsis sp. KO-2023]|nr:hypothetical protein BSKO_05082 [Bryopsis sp. KO-2023]